MRIAAVGILFCCAPAMAQLEGVGTIRSQTGRAEANVHYSAQGVDHDFGIDLVPENGGFTSFDGFSTVAASAGASANNGADTASAFTFGFDALTATNVDPDDPDAPVIDTPAESKVTSSYQLQGAVNCTTQGVWGDSVSTVRCYEALYVQPRQNLKAQWKITFTATVPDMTKMERWLLAMDASTHDNYCQMNWNGWDKQWEVNGWATSSNGTQYPVTYNFANRSPGDEVTFYYYTWDFMDFQEIGTIVTQINDRADYYLRGQVMKADSNTSPISETNTGTVTIQYIKAFPTGPN